MTNNIPDFIKMGSKKSQQYVIIDGLNLIFTKDKNSIKRIGLLDNGINKFLIIFKDKNLYEDLPFKIMNSEYQIITLFMNEKINKLVKKLTSCLSCNNNFKKLMTTYVSIDDAYINLLKRKLKNNAIVISKDKYRDFDDVRNMSKLCTQYSFEPEIVNTTEIFISELAKIMRIVLSCTNDSEIGLIEKIFR